MSQTMEHAVIPLGVAAVCVEDDAIFPVTERRCPHCGSGHFVLLERWLRGEGRVSKASEWATAVETATNARPVLHRGGLTFSVSDKGNLSIEGVTPVSILSSYAPEIGQWILDTFGDDA